MSTNQKWGRSVNEVKLIYFRFIEQATTAIHNVYQYITISSALVSGMYGAVCTVRLETKT